MRQTRKQTTFIAYPSPSPSPSPRELSPCPSSLEDYDGRADMSISPPTNSPPEQQLTLGAEATGFSPPSLRAILSNSAPPPWTLSAFMAFLSQNHCMETLEFTMDAERYRQAFGEAMRDANSLVAEGDDHVCALWQKLLHAYIMPYGPRELNLPSTVRDRLLGLPASPSPPDPSELDEAVSIVYDLMNDSVLVPFLAAVSTPPIPADPPAHVDGRDSRQGRSRSRAARDSQASADEPSRSPKTSFLPQLGIGRSAAAHRSGSSSADTAAAEHEGLTDDTGSSGSPAALEPMTPPTTPPTSDWTFGTSPGSLQRAISAHSNGWRKMGAKLGLSRKGRSKRSSPSNSTADAADAADAGFSPSTESQAKPPL